MYGLITKLKAVSGSRDELISILCEQPSEMPGCYSYVVALDQKEKDTIWVTELWDSSESHLASLILPWVQEAMARGKPLIASFDLYQETQPVSCAGLKTALEK